MKKKTKVAVAGLATVALVGGTFAIWQATTTVNNPFSTADGYGADTVEKFNPADGNDWEPGAEVEKEVGAVNTGDYPVYVRMKLDETWSRGEDTFKTIKTGETPADTVEDEFYNSDKILNVFQKDAIDGLVEEDDTVVEKIGFNEDDWILGRGSNDVESPEYDDWYYYYKNPLQPGDVTENLISAVKLSEDADMGQYAEKETLYWIARDDDADLDARTVLKDENGDYADNFKSYEDISADTGNFADMELKNKTPVLVEGDQKATIENYVTYLQENDSETDYSVFTKDGQALDENAKGYADADYELTITAEFSQVNGCDWDVPDSVKNAAEDGE